MSTLLSTLYNKKRRTTLWTLDAIVNMMGVWTIITWLKVGSRAIARV